MKNLFILIMVVGHFNLSAQTHKKDWHLLYSAKDTNFGIGLTEALKNYPAPIGSKTVIVAVIDDGVDYNHPDLGANIWTNTNEIPGNAVDDDHNGYIDDIHGWDYLGNAGVDIEFDNLELTRLLRNYQKRFEGRSSKGLTKSEKAEYKTYKRLESEFNKKRAQAEVDYKTLQFYNKLCNYLIEELDSPNISLENLFKHEPKSVEAKMGYSFVTDLCVKTGLSPQALFDAIREDYEHVHDQINYHLNLDFDSRKNVGDYYEDATTLGYGNNDVRGPDGKHGTHVSGIIGAIRNNQLGVDGICPLIQIMVLRAVPNGDERDKDIAHAIRYAVDNGATVINMSFGKYYAYNAQIVKEAILYAESKDVLLVHGAGNDNLNNDKLLRYPSADYQKDSVCRTWIEVGACDRDQSPAEFSNYGKRTVHVFAPGVQIYSCIPNASYKAFDGTSMASPVVAGLAALIRAYYPKLTAIQVKQIIENSVVKPEKRFIKPGKKRKKVKYKRLCSSAGIVNVANALKAAAAASTNQQ